MSSYLGGLSIEWGGAQDSPITRISRYYGLVGSVKPAVVPIRGGDTCAGRMMSSWKVTGWGGVCGLGALSFLRIIAYEVERTERSLRARDVRAKKAYELEMAARAERAELLVAQPIGRGAQQHRDFVARN